MSRYNKEEDTTTSEASPTDEFIINRMRNSIHSFGSNSNLVLAASNMLNCAVDTTNNDTNANSLHDADDERSGGLYADDDFFDNRQQQQSQQYFNKETISSTTDIESPAINNNTTVAAIRSPSSLANTPRTARSNKSTTQSNNNNTSHMSLNDIESNNSNNNIIISSKPQSIISPLANPSFPISVDDDPISPSSVSRSQRSFASVQPSVASTKTWDDHYAENNNIIDGDRSNDHITWNNFNNTNKSDLYEDNGIMKDDITNKRRRKKRKIICILLVLVCVGAIAVGGVALHQALTNNGNSSNDSNANLVSETDEKGGSGVIGESDSDNEVPTYAPTFYPTMTEKEEEDGTDAPIQSPTNNNTIWTTEDQDTSPADQETNEQAESSPSSSEEESGVTIWTGTETDSINDSGANEQEVSEQEEDTAPSNNNEDEVVSAPFPLDTQEEDEAGNEQQEEQTVSSPSTTTPGIGFGVTIEDILTPSPVSSTPISPPPQPSTEPNESNGSTINNPQPPSPPVATTSVPTQRITNSPIINPITTSNPTTKNPTPNPTPPPVSIPVNNNLDTLDTVVASGTVLSYKDAFLQSSSTQTLNIQLKTDQYGEETSWTLYKVDIDTNMETDMIGSVDENTYVANEQVNLDISLSPGKYRFTLRDQFGDGFCCSNGSDGWYRVYLDNEEIFRGGWYRQEISHDILVGFDWESTMNERDNEWLIAHNIRREDWHQRNNGLPGYVPLKWSTELAKDAQSWADELLDDCDQEGIAHESDVEEGENLAKNFGNGGQWAGLYPPENILKRWVDDEEFWGYPNNAHLTQALWRASRYVGCGDSIRINSEGVTCRMQVCRYVRAGNCAMGSFQAKEGDNWMVSLSVCAL